MSKQYARILSTYATGLVAGWLFKEASGTSFADSVGSFTLTATPTSPTGVRVYRGKSPSLDSLGARNTNAIQRTASNPFNPILPAGTDWAISGVCDFSTMTDGSVIFNFENTSSDSSQIQVATADYQSSTFDGKLHFAIIDPNDNIVIDVASAVLTAPCSWCITRIGTTITAYVNGIAVGSATAAQVDLNFPNASTEIDFILKNGTDATNYCYCSHVFIWNGTGRTAAEVLDLHQRLFWLRMDTADTLADTANGVVIDTLAKAVTWLTGAPAGNWTLESPTTKTIFIADNSPAASDVWNGVAFNGGATTGTKRASSITNCTPANVKRGATIDDVTGAAAGGLRGRDL
jgi:hypothetical protein